MYRNCLFIFRDLGLLEPYCNKLYLITIPKFLTSTVCRLNVVLLISVHFYT
jgi:hypothetical protein